MLGAQFPFGIDKIGMKRSEKDDEYRKMLLDHYCLISNDFNFDFKRMHENYLLKNSRLPKEQYRYLCGALGENERTDMFIDMFNFTGNVIDSLKGEELGRPFPFTVVANSERINNRMERLKRDSINNLVEKIFQIEIDKAQKLIELEMKNIPKEKMEQEQAAIEEDFKKRFNNLPDIKKVFKTYDSVQSIEEITMNKVMKALYHKNNIKKVKNDCFEDLLITAGEFVEVYCDHYNSLPRIKRLNTLFTFYQKSPDVEFIQDSDFAGYRERISMTQVMDMFGEYLSDEDYNDIITQGANWGVLGMDQKFFDHGNNPDPWRSGRFGENGIGYGGGINGYDEWMDVGMEEYGSPHFGHIPNKQSDLIGLHTTMHRRNLNRYIDKYVVYWKSPRILGKLTYVDDFGDECTTIVDEDFVIPKDAEKVVTKRDNLTKNLIEYCWLDDRENKMSLQWITVNEVWKGVRLGRKHVIVEPLVATYKSLLNPFEVKLPIYGVVINNANALALSKMDAMKPWQKLYFAMMAKVLKMIYQDRGTWTFLHTGFFDKDFGIPKTMAIAEDQGYVLYNPFTSGQNGVNSMLQNATVAQTVDMTNHKAITQYLQILAFVEENIIKAAGMSPQRIAQTQSNTTATDNYRETQSSMNITEPLFYAHDVLWESIMKGYMEMTLTILSENTGILRDFFNDEEQTVIDLDYVSLVDNYNLRIGNSGKQVRILEQTQQLVQALVQNDKINLTQFISLMKSEDLTEFQHQLREVEEMNKKREEEMQKQQQQHEADMEAKHMKVLEDGQQNELDKEFLRGYMAYKRDEMKSVYENQSFDAEKDHNSDGIPDYLQLQQMKEKLLIEDKKVQVKQLEVENKAIKDQREYEIKQAQNDLKMTSEVMKSDTERKKLENQEKIEKLRSAKIGNKSK